MWTFLFGIVLKFWINFRSDGFPFRLTFCSFLCRTMRLPVDARYTEYYVLIVLTYIHELEHPTNVATFNFIRFTIQIENFSLPSIDRRCENLNMDNNTNGKKRK